MYPVGSVEWIGFFRNQEQEEGELAQSTLASLPPSRIPTHVPGYLSYSTDYKPHIKAESSSANPFGSREAAYPPLETGQASSSATPTTGLGLLPRSVTTGQPAGPSTSYKLSQDIGNTGIRSSSRASRRGSGDTEGIVTSTPRDPRPPSSM